MAVVAVGAEAVVMFVVLVVLVVLVVVAVVVVVVLASAVELPLVRGGLTRRAASVDEYIAVMEFEI